MLLAFFLVWILISHPATVRAQEDSAIVGTATMGVARQIMTQEQDIKDGAILSTAENGAVPSSKPFDSQVVGVVSRDAAIVFATSSSENSVPVISYGEVYMLVSSQSGPIKRGDILTTSTIPGVGVKATKSGYVLGAALEDFDSADPQEIGKIAVDLNLHYFNSKSPFPGSLSDIFKIALLPTKEGPSAWFKYLVAAAVTLSSFVLGYLTFGRTAAKGVEALGRNPAASRIIHLGIIFNIIIVIGIILSGLTVAFLILRL